jgi:hypothetical protein
VEILRKIGRENRKTKWARVTRDGCHPLTTWVMRGQLLTVYFGTTSMFITLWFGFDYGTNPPLGKLII